MTALIEALRTPEERFVQLPGYTFPPHYLDDLKGYAGFMRPHRRRAAGEACDQHADLSLPAWRADLGLSLSQDDPASLAAGHRVVAPDFVGFGRSDKPVKDAVYTFGFHRDMLLRLIERLDLQNVTMVVYYSGGLLGLTLPMEMPERFRRLLVLWTQCHDCGGRKSKYRFRQLESLCQSQSGLRRRALDAAHYAGPERSGGQSLHSVPFPDARYKAGVRRFPELVMVSPEMEGVDYLAARR